MRNSDPTPPNAREICFWLYRGQNQVLEGRFLVTATPGVSSYGDYREFNVSTLDHPIGLFQGAVIDHELLRDGSVSIELRYYAVEPDDQSPVGFTQIRDLKAGISMGVESGLVSIESVALGPAYELAFRSHRVA